MRLKKYLFMGGLMCVALLLFIVPAVSAADEGAVALSADTLDFDREAGVYQARGDVQLKYSGMEMTSREMIWNAETREARAHGAVALRDSTTELNAERVTLRLNDKTASVTNGRLKFLGSGLRISGEQIEKTGEADYLITNGTFTACPGDPPAWKFSLDELDVTVGGYAVGKHGFFYLHDIPVLYLPYLFYPVKSERESGFMLPGFGFSDRKGYQLSLAWYQVIGRNLDATFSIDYFSRLGYGKGVEYRYLLGRDNRGEVHLYHVNATNAAADNRYAGSWRHQGILPGQVRLSADLHYVSANDFYADFGEAAGDYNRAQLESTLYAGRNWGLLNLSGGFNYLRDLENDNDTTVQRLPEMRLAAIRRQLARTPLWWRFDGETTYFWRRSGMKGLRLGVRPALATVVRPGGFVTFESEVAWLERVYQTSAAGPGVEHQGVFDGRMALSTRLLRDFSRPGSSLGLLRHEIEPELSYHFIPDDDQSRLPDFDTNDRLEPRNRLRFSLTNRVAGRFSREQRNSWRELLQLRLAQEFDLDEKRREPQSANDQRRPWLPLEMEALLRPTDFSFIDLDLAYDHSAEQGGFYKKFAAFNLRTELHAAGENRLSVEYRYTRDELEYVGGEVAFDGLQPLLLTYRHRYALDNNRTLEQFVAAEYRGECWTLRLSLRNRPDDRNIYLTFELSGLDALSDFGGF
ncbi:MAG: LPS assembly protein LptD [Desulfuromonadales bacterium]|nr:LPS assembly protein LptD [Desulfuromonadales bacterium]